MFCQNCGKEIDEKAIVCPNCGVATGKNLQTSDNGGFGWGLLGFCMPVVGLVLFLVWKDSKPKTSKTSGIGALVSVGLIILFYVVLFIIGLSAGLNNSYGY